MHINNRWCTPQFVYIYHDLSAITLPITNTKINVDYNIIQIEI